MKVFLAFSAQTAEGLREAVMVPFEVYRDQWPAHYHKKWIPLAPSEEEALRRYRASASYTSGVTWVLTVTIPDEIWEEMRRTDTVVPNPGSNRMGPEYTDTVGHWPYGRVPKTQEDPIFPLWKFDHMWHGWRT